MEFSRESGSSLAALLAKNSQNWLASSRRCWCQSNFILFPPSHISLSYVNRITQRIGQKSHGWIWWIVKISSMHNNSDYNGYINIPFVAGKPTQYYNQKLTDRLKYFMSHCFFLLCACFWVFFLLVFCVCRDHFYTLH